jgi:hypothetical protein
MFYRGVINRCLATVASTLAVIPYSAAECNGPTESREASLAEIQSFIQAKQMDVLTFSGYSGAQYQDQKAMLERATAVLEAHNPGQSLVNIGATAVGIGAAYEIAAGMGFTTMGIVSKLALDEGVALSECVDYVFFVPDTTWGGVIAESGRLSPTSAAVVTASTSLVAIGGGDVTRAEALAARAAAKPVTFYPADMNHAIALSKAKKQGRPEPVDFRGSAHEALAAPGDEPGQ